MKNSNHWENVIKEVIDDMPTNITFRDPSKQVHITTFEDFCDIWGLPQHQKASQWCANHLQNITSHREKLA